MLRYAAPFLHVAALGLNVALLGEGRCYAARSRRSSALLAAALPGRARAALRRPLLRAHATRRSPLGLFDWLRTGTAAGWETPEGTRDAARRSTSPVSRLGRWCVLRVRSSLLAMLAIRLESPGPPIYRQRRVGQDGAPFDMLKLRTMVSGAEHMGAGLAVNEGDPRITRVGAFLRRFSIDELPNLVNVLRGEMSIVGPRPTDPGPGRPVHRPPARPPRGQAGHHGLGADQRPHVAAVGRADRARPLVRRAPHAARSTCVILWQTVRLLVTGDGLYKGATGLDGPRDSDVPRPSC